MRVEVGEAGSCRILRGGGRRGRRFQRSGVVELRCPGLWLAFEEERWMVGQYQLCVELCEAWLACIIENEDSVDHSVLISVRAAVTPVTLRYT